MPSFRFFAQVVTLLFLLSAVPVAFVVWLERAAPAGEAYRYRSGGWLRECAKWDDVHRRFLVSFMEGGLGQISVPEAYDARSPAAAHLREVPVVRDADLAGNASLGLLIDRPRNRVLVAVADVRTNRYSALAAYDLDTWNRLFLTQLNDPGERAFADDVAVDGEGRAYVTDARNSRIWRVGAAGAVEGKIDSPLFSGDGAWYRRLVGLNGIVHHPDGFLLAVHTLSGVLFKIPIPDPDAAASPSWGEGVEVVRLDGGLVFGDGLELVAPTRLVVVGSYPTARVVESFDGWRTASVVGRYGGGPVHRVATAATVKNGKVLVSHLVGGAKTHAIVEAVFPT